MTQIPDTGTPATENPPTEAETIIEAVTLLHSLCVPAADIAKQVDIDQATTEHVIQYGRLPQRQLCLAWADDYTPEVSR